MKVLGLMVAGILLAQSALANEWVMFGPQVATQWASVQGSDNTTSDRAGLEGGILFAQATGTGLIALTKDGESARLSITSNAGWSLSSTQTLWWTDQQNVFGQAGSAQDESTFDTLFEVTIPDWASHVTVRLPWDFRYDLGGAIPMDGLSKVSSSANPTLRLSASTGERASIAHTWPSHAFTSSDSTLEAVYGVLELKLTQDAVVQLSSSLSTFTSVGSTLQGVGTIRDSFGAHVQTAASLNLSPIEFQAVSAVPEPSTAWLGLLGAGVLILRRRSARG